MAEYRYSRWLFERALAAIYLIAFIAAATQFVPLLGERGLQPVGRWVQQVPFRASPSLFYFFPHDIAFRVSAWVGVALAAFALTAVPQQIGPWLSAATWAVLWALYLSFVNVGQTFYGFGWETLLCEVGFFTIFAGASRTAPSLQVIWIWRWTLFRLMFGAGLIKLRGDPCWRDLTCLHYYFETQPMPNALSWYFHWMPHGVHTAGVAINHFVEVLVPFAYFLPQPFASVAGVLTILFQLVLIVSGNLSWLNWLTLVLCVPLLSDRWLTWLPVHPPMNVSATPAYSRRCMTIGGGGCRAQPEARGEHVVARADDERQFRSAPPGEHVRRIRQHHTRTFRNRAAGNNGAAVRMPPGGRTTSSRASPAIRRVVRLRWLPIICASTG